MAQAQHAMRVQAPVWLAEDLVFTTTLGTALGSRNVNRQWAIVCRAAGTRATRVLDLRHAWATYLHERGIDLKTIQAGLRHTQQSTTQRYVRGTDARSGRRDGHRPRRHPAGGGEESSATVMTTAGGEPDFWQWCARVDGESVIEIIGPDAERIVRAVERAVVAYRDAMRPTEANGYAFWGPWTDA
jgi:hypothetical protein